jgi:hypothetical protein
MKPSSKIILVIVSLVIFCFAVTFVLLNVQVYRDWAFICENTGSRMGYRQWLFGFKTGQWYKQSPLEEFIQSEAPKTLIHRWTSYAGTGKNIFGMNILYGHGRPGAIIRLDHGILCKWIEQNDAATINQFYNLLISDDQKEIEKRVMEIWEEILNYKE